MIVTILLFAAVVVLSELLRPPLTLVDDEPTPVPVPVPERYPGEALDLANPYR